MERKSSWVLLLQYRKGESIFSKLAGSSDPKTGSFFITFIFHYLCTSSAAGESGSGAPGAAGTRQL